jgi:putative transposase
VLRDPLSRLLPRLRRRLRHRRRDPAHFIPVTNAVEALHRSLRKIIKTRGSFPNDDAALKLMYLAIKNAGMRWRRGIEWTTAMGQFAIQFGERFPGTTR